LADAGNDPVKRAGLVLDIVRSIAIIPNTAIRGEYVKECSTLLNVEEQMLYYEINKLKNNEQERIATRRQTEATSLPPVGEMNPTSPGGRQVAKFEEQERNILQVLVKFGDSVLYYADEEKQQPVLVGTYILEELEQDNLKFDNPIHALMLEEYKNNYKQDNFVAQHFFLYHQQSEISSLTADLISEKYTLSRIHSKIKKIEADSDRLIELAPRVVFEFKNCLILQMIRQKLTEMKVANDNKNNALVDEIMNEMSQLEVVNKQLSKTLGDRVLNKL
jgi:DNA primase